MADLNPQLDPNGGLALWLNEMGATDPNAPQTTKQVMDAGGALTDRKKPGYPIEPSGETAGTGASTGAASVNNTSTTPDNSESNFLGGPTAKFNYMNSENAGDPRASGWAAKNLTTVTAPNNQALTVNKAAAPHFEGFLKDLAATGYKMDSVAGYALRDKVGAKGISQHAFGNAIDINPYGLGNPLTTNGKIVTNLPPEVRQIAAKWGLSWGADFRGNRKDSMHFEWNGSKGTA